MKENNQKVLNMKLAFSGSRIQHVFEKIKEGSIKIYYETFTKTQISSNQHLN